MDKKEILSRVDHTLLAVHATESEIKQLCRDAVEYSTASVCVAPAYVKYAAHELEGETPAVCTVIGFPNGYSTTEVKCFEAENAVNNGADEIDMVIHIAMVKESRYDDILAEINAVKKHCHGKTLKVIIETCLLTEDEIIEMCKVINRSDADYIKTSTGFSTAGATFDNVALMRNHIQDKKIKAAGGIKSFDDAEKFISLGADRLGTSRLVKIIKEEDKN